MPAFGRFALFALLVALAIGGSGFLYLRSTSADFDRHARTIEAIGQVRHLNELLTAQVLAARFGLLNEYDPLATTELGLVAASAELRRRIAAVVETDPELGQSLDALDESIARRRLTVERFKAENSVLRNSTYYLPTAARELETKLTSSPDAAPLGKDDAVLVMHRLVEAALFYNLVGDTTTRDAHLRALARLKALEPSVPDDARPEFATVLAHAKVVGEKQISVDGRVKEVAQSDATERLRSVDQAYHARFGAAVSLSNRYRKILYGWSLVLAFAVGAAGLQLRRLYADLERRVADRTAELQKALAALWGEMRLARKIQEALVPGAPLLDNCEVAATMKATDEVGGDYYDVIRVEDKEWILIGDVSGHGVSAGLVMMMCHTAVRTVLRAQPDVTPDRLLSLVNGVLTENIRQLGEDKYMTISAFRRDADGTVRVAGAHQDICIYRAETDSVEIFEPTGFWLGIKEHLGEDALPMQRFQLGSGDLLLLYTDGITEAMRDGAMFDVAGVRRVLDRAKGKTAQQVLSEIFAELKGFELVDDATVLAIRQLGNGPAEIASDSRSASSERSGESLG
jgi:serine phosphatase RsbU (regulator of sigma subunit)